MSDHEDFGCNSKIPEMEGHSSENNLQDELEEILNYESPPEKDDLATDDNCILFENDLDNVEPDIEFGDPSTASLFKYGNKTVLRLTDEEKEVIKKCTDPVLQRCLILNRLKMQQLKHMRARLAATLNRWSDDIEKEQVELSQQNQTEASLVQPAKTYICKLGMPYFKDHEDYGAPPNIDCLKKLQNKEYTITEFSEGRRWVDGDQMILRSAIEASYYNYCVSQLEGRIYGIERQIRKVDNDEEKKQSLQSDLNNAQQNLEALQSEEHRKTPPYGSDTGIDWLWIAAIQLNGQHTISECKGMWKIYLHPHISKKDWTPEENEQIMELAAKYKYQDWDAIAAELGTNRSGYLICIHYYTKLCDKFNRDRFSPSEDKYLLEIIEICRMSSDIPWASVASFFEDRSRRQLYHRYKYYLSCKNMKKGAFAEAEDILLAHLVQRFGKDYAKVSKFFLNRTPIQLRNRYSNYLEKRPNLGNFTSADDKKILDYVKVYGNKKWAALAQQLNRTGAHVRQRYIRLTRWLTKTPNLKVEEIPRRKQTSRLLHSSERRSRMLGILKKLAESNEVSTLPAVEALLDQQEEKTGQTTTDPAGASKVGRPNKKSYPKVLKMLEANKRQRGVRATIEGTEKQESADTSNTELESEDGFQPIKKIKRPRALKPKKPKSNYTVQYLPRRAKTKKKPAKDEKLPREIASDPCSSSTGQLTVAPSTDVGIQRVVNISDLKLPEAENVPLIDRSALLKLDQANSTSKIVILEKVPSVAPGKMLPSLNSTPEETIAHPLPDISEDDPPRLKKQLKNVKQYIARKSKQPTKHTTKTGYQKPNELDIMQQEDDSDDKESKTFEDDLRALEAVYSKINRETDAPEVMEIDNSIEEDLAMELQMSSLEKLPEYQKELTPQAGSSGVQLSAEIKELGEN